MKWAMGWTALVGVLVLAGMVIASPKRTNAVESARLTRACWFPIGGWTEIDCSGGAEGNVTALTAATRYVAQCVGNSHVAWGDATNDDADADDGYLPGGEWLEFLTDETVKWFSCDSAVGEGGAGKCYIIECQ